MAGLNIPSLKIDILADGSQAIQEIKDVKSAALEMTRIGGQMTKFTTVPIVTAIGAAVDAASDFAETMGKTDVVFGQLTDSVVKWSENSIETMGMAQGTALDMAAAYGDMATGMGLAVDKSAEMSMGMTQLAADIASFKNKSLSDVNTALTGVFTGETEALKGLGIVMTQTNLQNYALSQGITKQIAEMSQAEQVMLRYNYVMAQSANAQGDFARTGGSLANQTRKLRETIKQLGEDFGGLLTDKVANVVGTLQQGVQSLAELDDGAKNTILTIGMIVAAAGPLLLAGGKVITMVSTLKTSIAALAANPVALAVGGGLAAISALVAAANKAQKGLDEAGKKYTGLEQAIKGGVEAKITVDDQELKDYTDNPPDISIGVGASFNVDPETQADIGAFAASLEGLPKNEKYGGTGEFIITEATAEVIKEYSEALVAAATATGEFQEAVENLNNISDAETQRKIGEVNEQAAAAARDMAALLNEGYITESQYYAETARILSDSEAKIRQIEAEGKAQKELNQIYADGIKSNDYGAAARALAGIFKDEALSEEQIADAGRRLIESQAQGLDMAERQQDAQVTLNDLRTDAIAKQDALTQAVEKYNVAMAEADANERAGSESANEQIARARLAKEVLQNYADLYTSGAFSPDEAISYALEKFSAELQKYEGLHDELKNTLQGEVGEGLSYAGSLEALNLAENMEKAAIEEQNTAIEEAKTKREQALSEFTATVTALQEGYSLSATQGALVLVEETGVAVSEMDRQLIEGTAQAVSDMAATLESGGDDIAGAMETALAQLGSVQDEAKDEGKDIGVSITAGVAQGIKDGTEQAMSEARTSARMVTDAYKNQLDIHSPSGVSEREVGKPFMQGIGLGFERELPNVLQTIRRSTEGIISSATAVVNHGEYTAPINPAPVTQTQGLQPIDYERLADAVSRRPISFNVDSRELATATRDEAARQQALRVRQVNAGYGSIGG